MATSALIFQQLFQSYPSHQNMIFEMAFQKLIHLKMKVDDLVEVFQSLNGSTRESLAN